MSGIHNGREPYPYDAMTEWLEELNEGVQQAARWTVVGKDPERRILVMDRNNDPYYAGQGWQRENGEWFAEFHSRRAGSARRHIRALFYIASGEDEDPITGEKMVEIWPDGTPVDKHSKDHWERFQLASKFARNMELVDAHLIVDTKVQLTRYAEMPEPVEPWVSYSAPEVELPNGFSTEGASVSHAAAYAMGYHSARIVPSVVEVWVEKELDAEDEPILKNVCSQMGANLVVGQGNMKISVAYAAIRRQQEYGLPMRILYLSDFDDGGAHMPISPARHIEFAIRNMDPKPDIRLYQLALTAEQVRAEKFPTKPPTSKKDEDTGRARNFHALHGNLGTVQLNALTDSGPRAEWFKRLLRDAIRALRDPELTRKELRASRAAREMVDEELEHQMRWPHRALELIAERADEVAEQFSDEREEIARKNEEIAALVRERDALESALDEKLDAELEPLRERAEAVQQSARERLARLDELELPTVEAEEPEGAAEGWLFDSRRPYMEQRDYYLHHKYRLPVQDDG